MKQVSKQQIQEWVENPVTEALLGCFRDEIELLEKTPVDSCLIPGEPQKTQDNLVTLNTQRHDWSILTEILTGDWSYFMEEDSERDLSERE